MALYSFFTATWDAAVHQIALADGPSLSIQEGAPRHDDRMHDQTGLRVWGASLVLGRWVASEMRAEVEGNVVCELGAGCGVVGLAAAQSGAQRVLFTDLHPPTLDNLRHNVQANRAAAPGCGLEVCELDWSTKAPPAPVRVVVGADLIYDEETPAVVARLVYSMLEVGGVFLYAFPFAAPSPLRVGVDDLADRLKELGMVLEVDRAAPEALLSDPCPCRGTLIGTPGEVRTQAQPGDAGGDEDPSTRVREQLHQKFWLQCYRRRL